MTPRPIPVRDARARFDEIAAALQASHGPALARAALVLHGSIRQTLSQPGRGRTYKSRGVTSRLARKGTKRRAKQLHVASAPGDPPAVDTGFLRASVTLNPQSDGTVRVGPAAAYAAALEHGTLRPVRGVGPRRGPSVNRKHLASVLRKASASRSLVSSVARRGTGRLAPRPFMQRSLEAVEQQMVDVIVEDMRGALLRVIGEG